MASLVATLLGMGLGVGPAAAVQPPAPTGMDVTGTDPITFTGYGITHSDHLLVHVYGDAARSASVVYCDNYTVPAVTCTVSTSSWMTPGVTYYYNSIYWSSVTHISSLVYQGSFVAPAVPDVPSGVGAVSGVAAVVVSWTEPAGNGSLVDDYKVEYSGDNGSSWSSFTHSVSTSTSLSVDGLSNGTAYVFRVSAHNSVGYSAVSSTASATPATVPGVPSGLSGSVGNTQVTLSWTPSSDGGAAIDKYKVEYKVGTATNWSLLATEPTTESATVTNLVNGTAYVFRVSAHNSVGYSAVSSTASATPATVPDVPTSLSGVAGNTQVTLSWSAPSSDGGATVDKYKVEYKASTATSWTEFGTEPTTESATVTNLVNGTAYDFRVSAHNSVGYGTASTTASATPVAPVSPVVPVAATPAVTPDPPEITPPPTIPQAQVGGCSVGSSMASNLKCLSNVGIRLDASSDSLTSARVVNRASVATFLARLWRASGQSCPTASSNFADAANSAAGPDIDCVYQVGLTHGTSASTFSPNDPVTREQIAAFIGRLWRSSGRSCPAGSSPFGDASGSFAKSDIDCIYQLGITRGSSEGVFDPKGQVTGDQIALFLARTIRMLSR